MTREEYIKYAEETGDWAPGWEAIDSCFEVLYPGQEPHHFATNIESRAMFGGESYLDGYSIYQSNHGYKHIVTYGLSELYSNANAYGGEFSKWGYEMTIKLPVDTDDECMWAIDVLSSLARYTFVQKRFFEPFQFISGGGNPIKQDSKSKLTAFIVIQDTELKEIDTLHGKLDFMQLVGITQNELEMLIKDHNNAKILVEKMKKDNPVFITDLSRTKEYL